MAKNDFVGGRVEILLTSADIHSALQKIVEQGIHVQDITYVDALQIRFSIPQNAYDPLASICEKRGDTLNILHQRGLRYLLTDIWKRPILIIGLLCIYLLSIWLPTRVLFVRVEGNYSISAKEITDQAALCGIRFGVSCRSIRSDQVKNALLSAIPQLQWAGVNTQGCTAVITVREGSVPNITSEDSGITSIVALRDGIIRQITVQEGNLLCTLGQAVTEGQILVSPYTDCGLCIRVTKTKAEIYGDTQRQLTVICPIQYRQRAEITARAKKYSLIIGKKRINFYKGSGISGGTCAKIYEEKYVTLPGGFILPVGIASEEIVEYELQPIQSVPEESLLARFAENYLLSKMLAGKIQQADHVFSNGPQYCRLDSAFSCYELIGITHPEEGNIDHEQSD